MSVLWQGHQCSPATSMQTAFLWGIEPGDFTAWIPLCSWCIIQRFTDLMLFNDFAGLLGQIEMFSLHSELLANWLNLFSSFLVTPITLSSLHQSHFIPVTHTFIHRSVGQLGFSAMWQEETAIKSTTLWTARQTTPSRDFIKKKKIACAKIILYYTLAPRGQVLLQAFKVGLINSNLDLLVVVWLLFHLFLWTKEVLK